MATEQTDPGESVPSAGACMRSLAHVLAKTEGVLDKELRSHLHGVLRYVAQQEATEHFGSKETDDG